MPDLIYNKERKEMSEDNKQNFIEKLKKDKKFRFELIIGIWSGVISVILVVAVVFASQSFSLFQVFIYPPIFPFHSIF